MKKSEFDRIHNAEMKKQLTMHKEKIDSIYR